MHPLHQLIPAPEGTCLHAFSSWIPAQKKACLAAGSLPERIPKKKQRKRWLACLLTGSCLREGVPGSRFSARKDSKNNTKGRLACSLTDSCIRGGEACLAAGSMPEKGMLAYVFTLT
eukprot:1078927-Pelagomonas_calceolata.AAC.6